MSRQRNSLILRRLVHRWRVRPALALAAAALAGVAAGQPGGGPWDALPRVDSYDPAIPAPAAFLGFEPGEQHVRHDQLAAYVRRLAELSPRLVVEEQGRTHEGRPQLLLTVSSPGNLARREEIRRRHAALSEPPFDEPPAADLEAMPVVVWLGYSIHGDEASGANAALLVAYHLAAARGREVEDLLARAVVLLDPSLNPDGLDRFAQWANAHRGAVPVDDPEHREHVQPWPSGRTNHYWFDLNRDWLLVQQPESRARVATFQRWRPNLVADFHEMGSDATFFFQPGVPARQNPLTPPENLELTRAIAGFHAAAFDRAGRLYFTEETYDDFYYGKGSTYPDVQGAVGILFEQASARGHRQQTENGLLTFADAIANQVRASFSTLAGADDKRRELLAWQREAYRRALAAAARAPVAGWVVGDGGDPARAAALLAVLRAHGVEVRLLPAPWRRGAGASPPAAPGWCPPSSGRHSSPRPSSSGAPSSPNGPSTTSRPGPSRWPSACPRRRCRGSAGRRSCWARRSSLPWPHRGACRRRALRTPGSSSGAPTRRPEPSTGCWRRGSRRGWRPAPSPPRPTPGAGPSPTARCWCRPPRSCPRTRSRSSSGRRPRGRGWTCTRSRAG